MLFRSGLLVSVGPVVEVLDRITTDADGRVEYHYVLVDYACRVVGGQLRPGSDVSDAAWASPDALASFRLPPLTMAVIDKALRMSLG